MLIYDSFFHPFGKSSSTFNFRPYIEQLKNSYFETIVKDIYVSCVYNKYKESYIFFFRIPSAKNDVYVIPVYFDVVLEFVPKNKVEARKQANLKDYNIGIYSNSPNFMFSFTYVLNKQHSLAPCVPKNKYSKLALTKSPDIKNSMQIMTIEKTTFYALYHLDYNSYLNKDLIQTILSKNNETFYINKMSSQDEKMKEIKTADLLLREERNNEKNKKRGLEPRNSKYAKPIRGEDSTLRVLRNNPLKQRNVTNTLKNKETFKIKQTSFNNKNYFSVKK